MILILASTSQLMTLISSVSWSPFGGYMASIGSNILPKFTSLHFVLVSHMKALYLHLKHKTTVYIKYRKVFL